MFDSLNTIAFDRPALLWSIPVLWLVTFAAIWRRRSPARLGGAIVGAVIRSSILSLVALTLAGPTTEEAYLEPIRWIVAHDRDERREAGAVDRERALANRIADLDSPEVDVDAIDFTGRSLGAEPDAAATGPAKPAAAFEAVRRLVRPDRRNRVVLLTDARFSAELIGSDWPGGASPRPHGVRLYHVPPAQAPAADPRVRALRVPARIDADERFELEARLRSDAKGVAEIVVAGLGGEPRRVSVDVSPDDRYVSIPAGPLPRGQYAVDVTLRAKTDREPRNNRLAATVRVDAPPRVLIIDADGRDGGALKAACLAQGVTPIVAHALPPSGLDTFRVVVLRNRPRALADDAQRRLVEFVANGGGLLVTGGPAGDGLAGFLGRPLAALLPITPRPKPPEPEPSPAPEPSDPEPAPEPELKESEGPASSISTVLLLDISDSMNETTPGHSIPPIRYAKEAAISAARKLRDRDRLAVVCFNTTVGVVVPLEEIGERRDSIRSRLATIRAAGGTRFLPALERAFGLLERDDARVKHVILLTDGARLDTERYKDRQFQTLAGRMADRKITLTAVGLGLSVETRFLAQLVKWNGQRTGGLFLASSPTEIPGLFTLEVDRLLAQAGGEKTTVPDVDPSKLPSPGQPEKPTTKRDADPTRERPAEPSTPPSREPIPVRAAGPHPVLVGLDAVPPITGFDAGDARPLGWVALETDDDAPVLITRPYGLGRVLALTTDLGGHWSEAWIRWPHLPRLLAQCLRFLGRAPEPGTPLARDGRAHSARFDVTGEDALQRRRLVAVTGADPLPTLTAGAWPGESERRRRRPLEPYALLLAAALLPLEVMIRRFSR